MLDIEPSSDLMLPLLDQMVVGAQSDQDAFARRQDDAFPCRAGVVRARPARGGGYRASAQEKAGRSDHKRHEGADDHRLTLGSRMHLGAKLA
jgi:hypothetical protein